MSERCRSALQWRNQVFIARRYASAIHAKALCPSICMSVTNRYCIETTGLIELVFGTCSTVCYRGHLELCAELRTSKISQRQVYRVVNKTRCVNGRAC